jgi:hypothetical protein
MLPDASSSIRGPPARWRRAFDHLLNAVTSGHSLGLDVLPESGSIGHDPDHLGSGAQSTSSMAVRL